MESALMSTKKVATCGELEVEVADAAAADAAAAEGGGEEVALLLPFPVAAFPVAEVPLGAASEMAAPPPPCEKAVKGTRSRGSLARRMKMACMGLALPLLRSCPRASVSPSSKRHRHLSRLLR